MLGLGLSLTARPVIGGSGAVPADLDLNFLADPFDARLTVTRSGTATCFDATGALVSVAANTARIDHDPVTLARRGLLVEEARTNALKNNTMAGGVAGTPGTVPTGYNAFSGSGLTRDLAFGTEAGMPYIQIRVYGTASGAIAGVLCGFVGSGDIPAASGQTWTGSVYVRQTAGTSKQLNLTLTERDAGGALLASTGPTFTPTSSYARQAATRAFNNASTALATLEMRFNMTAGEVIDATFRLAVPQVELGAFATSVILTSGTAVTRQIDFVTMPVDTWFNASAGTLVCDFTPIGINSGATLQTTAYLDDTTATERMGFRASSGALAFLLVDGNVTQASPTLGSGLTAGTNYRMAGAYALNDIAGCLNGGTVLTDTAATIPTVTRLLVGSRLSGTDPGNAHFRRVRYFGTRKPNAELQSLTA